MEKVILKGKFSSSITSGDNNRARQEIANIEKEKRNLEIEKLKLEKQKLNNNFSLLVLLQQ
jgi:ketol-acid reductoisomerase